MTELPKNKRNFLRTVDLFDSDRDFFLETMTDLILKKTK
jgi:hypothetical protein